MNKEATILRVALSSPLYRCFDYLLPPNVSKDQCHIGTRVRVPFGRQEKVGIVTEITHQTDIALSKLKEAFAILDDEDILTPSIRELCEWVSNYYHHPLGDVLIHALPNILRKKDASLQAFHALKNSENFPTELTPNVDQQKAIDYINQTKNFQCFLLDGVTGSGKTEVYLCAIDEVLSKGQQVLVLVPEIGLTPQTVARFERRFSQPIAIIHSKLSEKKRYQAWAAAKSGEAKIIIGTRSAIWTPMPDLGLIILDEEHDASFKQQSGCRFSARDLGIMRAKLNNIPIVLGSATPSLESLYNVERGYFKQLPLPQRVGNAVQPKYHVIDIRNQPLDEGLSPALVRSISQHLASNNQVLVFLNRRGFAPVLMCHECGWFAKCPHCETKMTFHRDPPKLQCHHCGISRPKYSQCLECQSPQLLLIGIGTERLEQALQRLFPKNEVIRIDRDSTRLQGSMQAILDNVTNGQGQILVGTQMLAKGHHFPNVTLVAILDVDSGLFSADFRASERFGQLVTQVSGRAGRAEKKGEMILQTHHPEHPLLQRLIQQDYSAFAQQLLTERRASQLPPYHYLAIIRAESKNLSAAQAFLKTLMEKFPHSKSVLCFGPVPALMFKKNDRYQLQIYFQTEMRHLLQQYLSKKIIPLIEKHPNKARVRWSIDVDPQEL